MAIFFSFCIPFIESISDFIFIMDSLSHFIEPMEFMAYTGAENVMVTATANRTDLSMTSSLIGLWPIALPKPARGKSVPVRSRT
jgi:hypothetical protein